MLDKRTCLMLKSVLKTVESTNYRIDSLFSVLQVLAGKNLSETSTQAFLNAASNLRKTVAHIDHALDTIAEQKDICERISTDVSGKLN